MPISRIERVYHFRSEMEKTTGKGVGDRSGYWSDAKTVLHGDAHPLLVENARDVAIGGSIRKSYPHGWKIVSVEISSQNIGPIDEVGFSSENRVG